MIKPRWWRVYLAGGNQCGGGQGGVRGANVRRRFHTPSQLVEEFLDAFMGKRGELDQLKGTLKGRGLKAPAPRSRNEWNRLICS